MDPAPTLALVRDLIFSTKISSTAKSLGVPLTLIRDPSKLADASPATRLIVDLNLESALPAAGAWKSRTNGKVIAFVSHVDTELIRAARAAGFEEVLPRSEFTRLLPDLLADE
jgi:hypothetical protein